MIALEDCGSHLAAAAAALATKKAKRPVETIGERVCNSQLVFFFHETSLSFFLVRRKLAIRDRAKVSR